MQQKKILVAGIAAFNNATGSFQHTTSDELKHLFEKNNIPFICTPYHKNRLVSLLHGLALIWSNRREIDIAILPLFGTYNSLLWQRILSLLLKTLHKKIILVIHGGSIPAQLQTDPGRFLGSLKRASVIVAPSSFTQKAVSQLGFEPILIENVIPVDNYLFRSKEKIKPRLVWMRAFSDIYNPQMAVRTAKLLAEKFEDFKMVMAGADRGNLAEIKDMITRYDLDEKIYLAGYIDTAEKNKLAAEYDIYINTNKIDNAPVSVIEYMLMGLPVVAVSTGGIPYIIEDRKNGLLVEPGNEADMAAKITMLVEDPAFSAAIANKARNYAENYDEKNILHKWAGIISTLRKHNHHT